MPTVRAITNLLLKAGFPESKAIKPRPGQKARNLPGFRVASAAAERRAVYVYHVGRNTLPSLQKYAGTLSEAGLWITRRRGGLFVRSKRSPLRRGLEY